MNTKKYKELLQYSLEHGDIPQDLYDRMLAEIARDGKMNKRIYGLYLSELEARRLFFVDGAPFDTTNSAKTDGTYIYKRTKNPFWHLGFAVIGNGFKVLGGLAAAIGFGVWRVKDRKKLRKLGACVTLSNHVGYLDSLLTRRALGFKRTYAIVAPHNCKNNIGGKIMGVGGCLPLPSSMRGLKPFTEMLEYCKSKKAAIHFYAEQSMWIGYEKPRPYKDGAMLYADKLDLPVVPMFYCFGKARGLRKLLHMPKVTIKIGEPIYADKSLPPNKCVVDLRERAMAETQKLYEEFFGKPLEYINTVDADGEKSNAVENTESGDTNGKNNSDR